MHSSDFMHKVTNNGVLRVVNKNIIFTDIGQDGSFKLKFKVVISLVIHIHGTENVAGKQLFQPFSCFSQFFIFFRGH